MTVRSWIQNLFASRVRRQAPHRQLSLEALEERSVLSVTFAPVVQYDAGTFPIAAAVGDFNGDSKADLAVANRTSNNVSVLLGNGDGSFQGAVHHGVGEFPCDVAVGDFNGDGKQDLATANLNTNNIS